MIACTARSVNAVPEQEFVGTTAGERRNVRRNARRRRVGQAKRRRIVDEVVEQPVCVEPNDPDSRKSCREQLGDDAVETCVERRVSPVANCIAPGLIWFSLRIAGVSPTLGARQTRKSLAPAAYSAVMLCAMEMFASWRIGPAPPLGMPRGHPGCHCRPFQSCTGHPAGQRPRTAAEMPPPAPVG